MLLLRFFFAFPMPSSPIIQSATFSSLYDADFRYGWMSFAAAPYDRSSGCVDDIDCFDYARYDIVLLEADMVAITF